MSLYSLTEAPKSKEGFLLLVLMCRHQAVPISYSAKWPPHVPQPSSQIPRAELPKAQFAEARFPKAKFAKATFTKAKFAKDTFAKAKSEKPKFAKVS